MDFRLPSCLGGGESSKPRVTLSVGRMAGRLVRQNVFRKTKDKLNYRVVGRERRGEGASTLSASQGSLTPSLRQVISRKKLLKETNTNLAFFHPRPPPFPPPLSGRPLARTIGRVPKVPDADAAQQVAKVSCRICRSFHPLGKVFFNPPKLSTLF